MSPKSLDFSSRGRARVFLLTALGTLCCIAVSLLFDSYSFSSGTWRWGENPLNNIVIPLLLAPPFFYLLLNKMRDLAIAHDELMVHATTDSLTSCLNRRAFTMMVEGYLDRVADQRAKDHGALLVIDVDHFKSVNDKFGHDLGDEALKLIARKIKATLRETDLLGRLGGEEFCVFLPGLPPERATAIAERIRQDIHETHFSPSGDLYSLSVSVGGATFESTIAFSELYRRADQKLYAAKEAGRNRVVMQNAGTSIGQRPVSMH